MKSFFSILLLFCLHFNSFAQQTPQKRAESLTAEHDKNLRIWTAKINQAKNKEQLEKLLALRPDTKAYSEALLKTINPYLKQEWSVKHMAWLIRNHPNLILKAEQSNAGYATTIDREDWFMQYFEQNHIKSADAGEFVLSLTARVNPKISVEVRKRYLAEQVVKKNPHNKNIGLASLAHALLLPVNKSDPTLKRRKLAMFKTAINFAADEKIGNLSVAKLISEQLYHMNNLEVGRPVLLFKGMDATGLEHQISDYKGKVIMLVFWTQHQNNSLQIAQRMNKLLEKNKNEAFVLLGVTKDSVQSVRKLRGERKIQWRNFFDPKGKIFHQYRVPTMPYCYIINKRGDICYGGVFGGWSDTQVLAAVLQEN